MGERSTNLTLAFTLAALRELADPQAAVEDARTWSRSIGAVSTRPNGALAYTNDRRVRLDFFSGTRPPAETLHAVRREGATERYVLVGVEGEASLASEAGWEFEPLDSAAERAGWTLAGDTNGDGEGGLLDRAVDRLERTFGR